MSFNLPFVKPSKKAAQLCRMEIRTDTNFVIFRGSPDVTGPQKISGRIVLMNSEPVDAKSISIRLEGIRRTSHNISSKEVDAGVVYYSPFIRNVHTFHSDDSVSRSSPLKIPPGNHEWPFEFELPGDAFESIEGFPRLPPIFQIYQLNATIQRSVFRGDLVDSKHVRVVRTIGNNPDELLIPESISGNWVEKIMYEWSIATRRLIYGDKVTIDFSLTPLADKLRIGKIKFWIREIVRVRTLPGPQDWPDAALGNMWEHETNTAEQEMDPPDNDPATLHPQLLIPQQNFSMTFDLPKSLNDCRQSVDVGDWIHIRHRLQISIHLHNADGHLSELKGQMPIQLYISPHLLIGDDNSVSALPAGVSSLTLQDQAAATPPTYENHTHDQPLNPFSDISPSGFVTPAAGSTSGTTTPGRSYFENRASSEQIQASAAPQGPLPHDLAARLQNLDAPSPSGMGRGNVETVQHVDYNLDELERVTSYNTAVRHPGPANYSNLPPTYADATSTPPSPQLAPLRHMQVRDRPANGESSASGLASDPQS